MSARQLRAWLGWLFAAGYLCLIWALSSKVLEFAVLGGITLHDKAIHFVEYGALSTMLVDALAHGAAPTAPWRAGATAVWLSVCAGLLDEFHQVLVFGRSGDVHDLLADALGALSATLLYFGVRALFTRVRARSVSPP